MLGAKKYITLTLVRNFVRTTYKNALILIISLVSLGILGFNLWFLLAKPIKSPPPPQKIVSQNLSAPAKTFAHELAEATKAGIPTPQIAGARIEGKVTIALLGDSMVQTLGDLRNLALSAQQYYPRVEFNLLNYGVGATTPVDGLARLTKSTSTSTEELPPLLSAKPDIVVLESFSYNHGKNTQSDINNHYSKIGEIIEKLEQSNITPLFLVTIAPSTSYAKGVPNILWDENQRELEAETIISYLRAGLKFAQDQKLILVDSFNPSLASDGFGKQIYVNSADNIHPSSEGIELISDLIAQKISQEKIIEKVLEAKD